jgi:replicative DNA helicase
MNILIVSLEMPAEQVFDRMIGYMANVPSCFLKDGIKSEWQEIAVTNAIKEINSFNVVIRDDLFDLPAIMSCARSMARSVGLDYLVVDYIQLVRNPLGKRDTREREVAHISQQLRLLANETKAVVIGISQLNKDGTTRGSSAIEMDATCVMNVQLEDSADRRRIEVPLQRQGPCGVKMEMAFAGHIGKFSVPIKDEQGIGLVQNEWKGKAGRKNPSKRERVRDLLGA